MNQTTLTIDKDLSPQLKQQQIPSIGAQELLIKVAYCGICGGDLTPWYIQNKAPCVLGHEPSGTVVEVGEDLSCDWKIGDRVFIHHHAPCLKCELCQQEQFVHCPTWRRNTLDPGGMAEFVRLKHPAPQTDCLKIPDPLSFKMATLTEPIACVVKALKRAKSPQGKTVLLLGMGFIGQIFAHLLRHYGAQTIIASEPDPYRLEMAQKVCDQAYTPQELEKQSLPSPQLIIVGPSNPKIWDWSLKQCQSGGQVLFFMPPPPTKSYTIHPFDLFMREIDLLFSYSCGPQDTKEALELLAQNLFPEELISHVFPKEQAVEAYQTALKKERSMKVMVQFDPQVH